MTEQPATQGCHHIGLAVSLLEDSAEFFIGVLGWQGVRRDPEYPAIFVSDGTTMVTLWQLRDPAESNAFNRHTNAGLHHLALQVGSEAILDKIYEKLRKAKGVTIEFAPELLRQGPAKHMMCYEPSGIRVEFIWPGT